MSTSPVLPLPTPVPLPIDRRWLDSTPSRLRAWQVGTTVLAVLFGLLGAVGVSRRAGDLNALERASATLIDVQGIRVAAVRADSLASLAYLQGGQERAEDRQQFVTQIDTATAAAVAASERVPDTAGERLTTVTTGLSAYVGLVEQARANNRQGFPVGAAYQRQANGILSGTIQPALREVEQALREEVNLRLDRLADDNAWLMLPGLATLAAVAGGSIWLARHFRRRFNPALLGAGALVALGLIVVGGSLSGSFEDASQAVVGPLQAADLGAQARAAGYEARSQESLTLINRGNGAANEAAWVDSIAIATRAMDKACSSAVARCVATTSLREYRRAHATLRGLDNGGDWDQAVALITGRDNELVNAFDSFSVGADSVIGQQSRAAAKVLDDAGRLLGLWRVAIVLLGLAAAGLVMSGYAPRLEEYR